MSGLEIEYQ